MRFRFCLFFLALIFFGKVAAEEDINKRELLKIVDDVNWEKASPLETEEEVVFVPTDSVERKEVPPNQSVPFLDLGRYSKSKRRPKKQEEQKKVSVAAVKIVQPAGFDFVNPANLAESEKRTLGFLRTDLVYKDYKGNSEDYNFKAFLNLQLVDYSQGSWGISSQIVFDNNVRDFNKKLFDFVFFRSSEQKSLGDPNFGIGSYGYSYNKSSFAYAFRSDINSSLPVKFGVKLNLLTSISCFEAANQDETLGTSEYYIADIFEDFKPSFGVGFGFGAQVLNLPGLWLFENGRLDFTVEDLNSKLEYKSAQRNKFYYNNELEKVYVLDVDDDSKDIEYELEPKYGSMLSYRVSPLGKMSSAVKFVKDETAYDDGVSLGLDYQLQEKKSWTAWVGKGRDYFVSVSYSLLSNNLVRIQGGCYFDETRFAGGQVSLQFFRYFY